MTNNEASIKRARPKRIGLKDVALEAGVDVSTVSRILGGRASLYAEETCRKVQDAAAALHYRPNATARGMATGSTRMVGVTIPGTGYCGRIIEGINKALLEHGHLMLHAWNPDHFVPADDPTQKRIIHELVERQVDGVILRVGSEEFEQTYFEEIWQRGIPMIVVDREMALFKTDFVGTDDVAIGADAARHLLGLGHRRLLFVGEKEIVSTCRLREQGFRDVVSEAPDAACRKVELDLETAVVEDLAPALEGEGHPTGVFCYSDRMVPIFYETARKLGLDIPGDISVVGCGNLSWGKMLAPALSTFEQHPEKIGRKAAELYLERVAEGEQARPAPKIIRVAAELMVRGSTARV
ncbi:LacI family DNA-binding transcriptional regulator [Pontiella sulfatireligans]|uniref:HTH-type transcriptional regulator DegA n=1 Tax=Pontiella sulfatireligans TaxID=2750658 RepID=A0A6C2UFZ9_9BACT|nr:LacI family DNA-binding transcriptional regulator [Pontiella sulfatireligans]VGO18351.1 HTH-type transcriptional regulator DegA [Pontiella sulfatireligans]